MWTLAAIAVALMAIRLFVGLARAPQQWGRGVAIGYLWIYVIAVIGFAGYLITVGSHDLWTLLVVVTFAPGVCLAVMQLAALGRS